MREADNNRARHYKLHTVYKVQGEQGSNCLGNLKKMSLRRLQIKLGLKDMKVQQEWRHVRSVPSITQKYEILICDQNIGRGGREVWKSNSHSEGHPYKPPKESAIHK